MSHEDTEATEQSINLDEDQHHPSGFTIYRTDYTDGTDELWKKLLEEIEDGTTDSSSVALDGSEEDLPMLDARSDKDMLENLTIDELRTAYNNGLGGKPIKFSNIHHFLLADAEVFRRMSERLRYVKLVDGNYDSSTRKPFTNYKRFPQGQEYWGWMRLTPDSVFNFWYHLDKGFFSIEDRAPPMTRNCSMIRVFNGDLLGPAQFFNEYGRISL